MFIWILAVLADIRLKINMYIVHVFIYTENNCKNIIMLYKLCMHIVWMMNDLSFFFNLTFIIILHHLNCTRGLVLLVLVRKSLWFLLWFVSFLIPLAFLPPIRTPHSGEVEIITMASSHTSPLGMQIYIGQKGRGWRFLSFNTPPPPPPPLIHGNEMQVF